MISLTIARKYARALLEIGRREKNHEILGKELESLEGLLRANKELKAVLCSHFYPALRRKAIARSVGQSLALSPSTLDFLDLLIERNRMDHFSAIVKSYQELSDRVSNRLRATVASAQRLPLQLLGQIKTQLESTTGKEVILSALEDPSLIGGVVTKIGNIIYDGSLKTQLVRAKENLYKE
ncbi:MAG: ATP synthase F1 subunit delta [Syntrophaceae bacterium]|nr:ATP synthase F1 subunit delta [Syntrophaceae bacterium]